MKEILEILADGFDMIGRLTNERTVSNAAAVLNAIEKVWEAVDGAVSRRLTPDEARKELARLKASIAGNDAAADDALDAKFPTG